MDPEKAYNIKYMGGHPAYPKETTVRLNIFPYHLEIPDLNLELAYAKIQNIQNMTKEKLSVARIALTGLIGLAWKKKKEYMIITYEDEAGMEQNLMFDAFKWINTIQPLIYNRVVAAKSKTKTKEMLLEEELGEFLDRKD